MNELREAAPSVEAKRIVSDYEKNREKMLAELYSWNMAARVRTAPISQNTRAALYVKGLVNDILQSLYILHALFVGEHDDVGDEFVNAVEPIEKIVDRYIIESINENMSFRDFKEI